MNQKKPRHEWEKHVTAYRNSGQSAALWCQTNQISLSSLRYWIHKFNSETTAQKTSFTEDLNKWVLIDSSDLQSNTKEPTVTIIVGLASIQVAPGFHSGLLADVVRTLSALC